ncbi:hypothetical protein ACOCJ7_16210 [Knoellia sp. CPCC 206453]|uniref:hypothetical protein n=1 Tax=Knoellia pratensis TaxID=3404796 RepID=UPI0036075191
MQTSDGGALRFTPDGRRRRPRSQPTGSRASAAAGAIVVGGLSLRAMDLGAGLWIAGITVVVTLVAVTVWRWCLPRAVSLTVAPDTVTYRRFGRSTTIARGPGTVAVATLITHSSASLTTRYLCLRGDGGQFAVNLDPWSDLDRTEMVLATGAADRTETAVPVAVFDAEFPGLLPGHVLHPHRFALIFIVVAVAVIIGVTALLQL